MTEQDEEIEENQARFQTYMRDLDGFEIPFTEVFTMEQIDYLCVEPLPMCGVDVRMSDFIDNNITLFMEYEGLPTSRSGESSKCLIGKISELVLGLEVYFYTIDDPGQSGYDCCGSINLRFCTSKDDFIEHVDALIENGRYTYQGEFVSA